ncbi:TPA: hypothetical protein DIV48_01050 [Candidatus Kaiserbacteria bacterium]|nr:MAG: hypothetical protein UY93_C0002G0162 [Parcubacteria group bacterium GW2011_GWA1_56_13]KKW46785.1 MAG: hypothetical protein UY97_C0003G0059 [Parcubacteria group bacterium GW2011_GWB1_57_6]HCR52218.1 hypothetical protein [Candidatus Kaiserbacteria bacterium]
MRKALPFVFIVIAVAAGWQLGRWQALESAKARLAAYQLLPVPLDSKNVFGTIADIDGSTLSIRTSYTNPLEDAANIVSVAITDSTTIEGVEMKTQKVFDAEIQNFAKTAKTSSTTPLSPPEPFLRQALKASDLLVGQSVSVITAENAVGARRVTAVSILVSAQPPTAATSTTKSD